MCTLNFRHGQKFAIMCRITAHMSQIKGNSKYWEWNGHYIKHTDNRGVSSVSLPLRKASFHKHTRSQAYSGLRMHRHNPNGNWKARQHNTANTNYLYRKTATCNNDTYDFSDLLSSCMCSVTLGHEEHSCSYQPPVTSSPEVWLGSTAHKIQPRVSCFSVSKQRNFYF